MAGLLDAFNTAPGLLGLMLMQAGSAQPVRQSFGGGLLQALQGLQQHRNAEQDRAMRRDMLGLQLDEARASAADRERQRQQAERDAQALRQQFAPLPGPTPDGGALMPRFDAGAMLGQGASPQSVQQALGLHQAMQKPAAPLLKLSAGEAAFDPTRPGAAPVFSVPDKPQAASDLARLLTEMQALPPGSPARQLYEQQIRKITTHAPPQTSISLGSPVPVMLPDGTHGLAQPANRPGEPPQLLRDPATGLPLRAASTEKLKQVPSNINTAISENRAALAKIDQAIAAVERNPGALGAKNYLPDPLIQRADTAGVEPRALIADIGSLKIHDRSGAAVTAAEFPRLRPFIPAATDDPRVAATKLRQLRAEYQALLEDARLTYSTENGYRPPPVFTAPTRENAARGAPAGLPPMDAIEAELRRRAGGG